ncbi:heme/copper-type cytochrome/quinol oxidase subunit 1 [Mycobacterium sp. URHB0021]
MITTVVCMRAPGLTMFRMPIFYLEHPGDVDPGAAGRPILTAALSGLAADRHLGA